MPEPRPRRVRPVRRAGDGRLVLQLTQRRVRVGHFRATWRGIERKKFFYLKKIKETKFFFFPT